MRRYFVLLGLLLCCSFAFASTLDGTTVNVYWCGPCAPIGTYSAPVSFAATDFLGASITDTNITVTFTNDHSFSSIDAVAFSFYGGPVNLTATTGAGSAAAFIATSPLGSPVGAQVIINFTNSNYVAGDFVSVNLASAINPDSVPEPSTALLLSFGLPFLKRRHSAGRG